MRINKYVAQATGMSRRAADKVVAGSKVTVNGKVAEAGADAGPSDDVILNGKRLALPEKFTLVLLNKPVGYVCSRDGQGSPTIYELLPEKYRALKPVGRLDKDSSGLLLLTDDGGLANKMTHPRYSKVKIYEIELDKPLEKNHRNEIERGIRLEDGPSALKLKPLDASDKSWQVVMHEGRNRQIRRTFAALGYDIAELHRAQFGPYTLPANLTPAAWVKLNQPPEA